MKYTDMQKMVIHYISNFYLDKYVAIAQKNLTEKGFMGMVASSLTKEEKNEVQMEYDNAYGMTNKEIDTLKITRIDIDENYKITITLHRPGLLIGMRGENINALAEHLKKYISDEISIHIDEDHLLDYLYAQDYSYEEDW